VGAKIRVSRFGGVRKRKSFGGSQCENHVLSKKKVAIRESQGHREKEKNVKGKTAKQAQKARGLTEEVYAQERTASKKRNGRKEA